jgi:hypothetical protein
LSFHPPRPVSTVMWCSWHATYICIHLQVNYNVFNLGPVTFWEQLSCVAQGSDGCWRAQPFVVVRLQVLKNALWSQAEPFTLPSEKPLYGSRSLWLFSKTGGSNPGPHDFYPGPHDPDFLYRTMPRGPTVTPAVPSSLSLEWTEPPPAGKLVILLLFLPCLPLRADGIIASASE